MLICYLCGLIYLHKSQIFKNIPKNRNKKVFVAFWIDVYKCKINCTCIDLKKAHEEKNFLSWLKVFA